MQSQTKGFKVRSKTYKRAGVTIESMKDGLLVITTMDEKMWVAAIDAEYRYALYLFLKGDYR